MDQRIPRGWSLASLSGSLVLHGLLVLLAVGLLSRDTPPVAIIVELEEAVRVRGAASPSLPSRVISRPAPLPKGVAQGLPSPPTLAAERSPAPEPASEPEASPSPPAPAREESPPAVMAAPAERSAEVNPKPSGPQWMVSDSTPKSVGSGIQGGGPLAMLVPSAREGGEGAGGGEGEGAGILAAVPSRGAEAGIPAEFGPYLARFRQRVQEALDYPLSARRRGVGGTVHLEVELLPTGKVASVVVRSSSSHAILDQAALDTLSRLRPAPFPPGVSPRPLRVRLPIVFELK